MAAIGSKSGDETPAGRGKRAISNYGKETVNGAPALRQRSRMKT
jgi:hypothetical protein